SESGLRHGTRKGSRRRLPFFLSGVRGSEAGDGRDAPDEHAPPRLYGRRRRQAGRNAKPAPVANASKPGNEVATFAMSPTRTSPWLRWPATANDMAMR